MPKKTKSKKTKGDGKDEKEVYFDTAEAAARHVYSCSYKATFTSSDPDVKTRPSEWSDFPERFCSMPDDWEDVFENLTSFGKCVSEYCPYSYQKLNEESTSGAGDLIDGAFAFAREGSDFSTGIEFLNECSSKQLDLLWRLDYLLEGVESLKEDQDELPMPFGSSRETSHANLVAMRLLHGVFMYKRNGLVGVFCLLISLLFFFVGFYYQMEFRQCQANFMVVP